jgi:hypothetical protein
VKGQKGRWGKRRVIDYSFEKLILEKSSVSKQGFGFDIVIRSYSVWKHYIYRFEEVGAIFSWHELRVGSFSRAGRISSFLQRVISCRWIYALCILAKGVILSW